MCLLSVWVIRHATCKSKLVPNKQIPYFSLVWQDINIIGIIFLILTCKGIRLINRHAQYNNCKNVWVAKFAIESLK